MPGVIAPLPAVEGLRADIEVAAGKPGVVTTRLVVVKPFESLPGFFGWFHPKPCQTRDPMNCSTYYSHNDTIIVSPIYLN